MARETYAGRLRIRGGYKCNHTFFSRSPPIRFHGVASLNLRLQPVWSWKIRINIHLKGFLKQHRAMVSWHFPLPLANICLRETLNSLGNFHRRRQSSTFFTDAFISIPTSYDGWQKKEEN